MQEKIQQVTSAASYAASGVSTAVGLLTINNIAAIIGIVLGIATFVINWAYKHKHFKLARDRKE